ncbi:MAG: hypothetical protein K0R82_1133 [Flavipsychrobacter sp.]|jgi:hypothetical protein|nr:hypothetical protein [Flavipsychrobacter sp.]
MKHVFVLLASLGLFAVSCGDRNSATHEAFDDSTARTTASPADNAGGAGQSGPMVMDTLDRAADTPATPGTGQ